MSVENGILVLHKPAGITSRDAVDIACSRLKTREIGHCGTLDPRATGVLVLVLGKARRLQDLLSRSRKVYEASIRLGATSITDDSEGPITPTEPAPKPPSEETLKRALAQFVGEIEQRPPSFSAIKIQGKRLYDLARSGKPVKAPTRIAKVYECSLHDYSYPSVTIKVISAGGTYVRSIARDLGECLATGGYLDGLVRTESGDFSLEEAVDPDCIEESHVLPLEQALLPFTRIDIAASQARRLGNGAAVHADVPPIRLDQEDSLFGWVNGRAVALLKRANPGQVRSSRLLVAQEELESLAEQELAAEDAAAP